MKIDKDKCEICGSTERAVLDAHHVIPRTDKRCTNLKNNLICVCSNCHRRIHAGDFIIEGRYLTSGGPEWFWYRRGESWNIRPGVILLKDGTAEIRE